MTQNKSLYAIGFRHWVEIRASFQPPRVEVSEVEKMLKEKVYQQPTFAQYEGYYNGGRYPEGKWVVKPTKFKLKLTSHVGGRPVGCVNRIKFNRLLKKRLKEGGMVKLENKHIVKLARIGLKKLEKFVVVNGNNIMGGTV